MRVAMNPNSKYYVETHRKLELIHFCRQYQNWKTELYNLEHASVTPSTRYTNVRGKNHKKDPVAELAIRRNDLKNKIAILETVAFETDSYLSNYILLSVTKGLSFSYMKASLEIPCGADMWNDRIRKFYWLLDKRDKHVLL